MMANKEGYSPMTANTDQLSGVPHGNVLVLTDGSERAYRMTEWEIIFAEMAGATVHRIDIINCLDSGVVVRKHDSAGQDQFEQTQETPASVPTDCTANQKQENTTTTVIDVLHGVPHEAILGYVAANGIDCLIIVCERMCLDRSLLGCTVRNVSDAATVPLLIRS